MSRKHELVSYLEYADEIRVTRCHAAVVLHCDTEQVNVYVSISPLRS